MYKKFLHAVVLMAAISVVAWGCSRKPAIHSMDVVVLSPQTGPAGSYARYSQMGFDLAERDIKGAGATQLTVRYVDSKSNPKDAVTALNQALLLKKPDAVIVLLSSVLKAVGPILEEQNIPVVANAVAAPGVANPAKGLFRVFPTANDVAAKAVGLATQKGLKSMAVIYVNDEYGTGTKEAALISSGKSDLKVVTTEPFSPIEKDFRNQWTRILAEQPDCIFVAGYGPGYVTVLQQLGEIAYKGTVITDFTLSAPSVLKATSGVKEGAYVIAPAISIEFEQKALSVYSDAAYFVNVATAYDSLRLIAATSSGDQKAPLSKRIASVNQPGGAFGTLGLNTAGDEAIPLSVYEVKAGSLVKVE